MNEPIVLDSGPLGFVSNPNGNLESVACTRWLHSHLATNRRVIIPGIVDYEIWRELIRARKYASLRVLDNFRLTLEFLPVTQEAINRAAELWATIRQQGLPTADRHSIDADCILAAQVLLIDEPDAIIATLNVAHLDRFTPCALWQDIV